MTNIVLAEDDETDSKYFCCALQDIQPGLNLSIADNGRMLIDILETGDEVPDLIFLDLIMPYKTGFECLEEIRSNDRLKHTPVIVYSSAYNKAAVNHAYNRGADYFMRKPVLFEELKELIQQVFEIPFDGRRPHPNSFVITPE